MDKISKIQNFAFLTACIISDKGANMFFYSLLYPGMKVWKLPFEDFHTVMNMSGNWYFVKQGVILPVVLYG